jgi:hypothetical protein
LSILPGKNRPSDFSSSHKKQHSPAVKKKVAPKKSKPESFSTQEPGAAPQTALGRIKEEAKAIADKSKALGKPQQVR